MTVIASYFFTKLLEKVNSSLKKKNLELSPATSKLEISSSKII